MRLAPGGRLHPHSFAVNGLVFRAAFVDVEGSLLGGVEPFLSDPFDFSSH